MLDSDAAALQPCCRPARVGYGGNPAAASEAAMPEQLTKHPDVTLQVLRSAGAKCGEGAPQAILVQCPAQRFCQLPGGEICVYGLDEAPRMTQISSADWQALLRPLAPAAAPGEASAAGAGLALAAAALLLGLVLGAGLMRIRRR
jgi:hypothetical protein